MLKTVVQVLGDPRVEEVVRDKHGNYVHMFSDTPICMTRCKSVVDARSFGADVLVMIDSDMSPDTELRYGATPFWDVAFSFIYDNWDKFPAIVAAPYCGPPPHEIPYMFRWSNHGSRNPEDADLQLRLMERDECAEMAGLHPIAAAPTGLIAFAMPAFQLTEPQEKGDKAWFEYEWTDRFKSEKASTEDVFATRDLAMHGRLEYGCDILYGAFSSWAGHWKPKCVRKPILLTSDVVCERFKNAVHRLPSDEKRINFRSSILDRLDIGAAEVVSSNGIHDDST